MSMRLQKIETAISACEQCRQPAVANISYLSNERMLGAAATRVGYDMCSEHGAELWARLSEPLRSSAIVRSRSEDGLVCIS